MTATLDTAFAADWIRRWDAQQEFYVADREERFAVIGDVLAQVSADNEHPVVLDLGCGPGSLSERLARRLPGAVIFGIDADPVLLALARGRHAGRITFLDADLAGPDWSDGLPGTVDAVVSTTALHWLTEAELSALYRRLGELVRPGGVFVNGDHLYPADPAFAALAKRVREDRARRAGVTDNEDWGSWWAAVRADSTLGPLFAERSRRPINDHDGNHLSAAGHAELLRAAGFGAVEPVWQVGDDQVLVALR